MENSSHKVYSVFDSKVKSFDPPFLMRNANEALRSFSLAVNHHTNKDGKIATFPADFTLFEIGEWSDLQGKMMMYEAKTSLATGLDVKDQQSGIQALN
nr:MAG: nonstructural protein [Microvirus sp.]QJB19670.1 MAG: nonstructural protein [Microvirus sp.]